MSSKGNTLWWIRLRPRTWWLAIKTRHPDTPEDEWLDWRTREIQAYEIERARKREKRETAAERTRQRNANLHYADPSKGGVGGGPWPFDWKRALSEGKYRGFIAQSLRGYDESLYGVGDDHLKFHRRWLQAASDLYEQILDELARMAGHGETWRRNRGVFATDANIREGLRRRK